MSDTLINPRAVIGSNASPFVLVSEHIDDLRAEAKLWLDGGSIETEAQADKASLLLEEFRKARKAADEARKVEKAPFDAGAAEVQGRYNPLLDKCDLATKVCKEALAPYLLKLEEEKRAIAEAARIEAENAQIAAQAAFRIAGPSDLEEREAAEALARAADDAAKTAKRAGNDRASAKGGSRATTLRTAWEVSLGDERAALLHYIQTRPEAIKELLVSLAKADVRDGARYIPGITIIEQKVVV